MTTTADAQADAAFLESHRKNPGIYSLFVKYAREAKARGRKVGAKAPVREGGPMKRIIHRADWIQRNPSFGGLQKCGTFSWNDTSDWRRVTCKRCLKTRAAFKRGRGKRG